MKLAGKMLVYFMFVVAIGAIGFGFVLYNVNVAGSLLDKVKQEDMPRLIQTAEVSREIENKFASLRGFLISGDKVSLDNYLRVTAEAKKSEQELLAVARTEEGKKILSELMALDEKYSQIAETVVIPYKQAGKEAAALQVMNGELTDVGRQLRNKAKEYVDFRRAQIQDSMERSVTAADNSEMASIIAGLLSILVGGAIGLFAARSISRPVNQLAVVAQQVAGGDLTQQAKVESRDEIGQLATSFNTMVAQLKALIRQINLNTEQLAASSEELTASAQQSAQAAEQVAVSITQVANGASEQMAASDETSAVVQQMAAGVEEMAASANQVAAQSAQAADKAQSGGVAVDQAVSQMTRIENAVNTSATVITKLGEQSQEIGQIVDTIAGIAGQTNLLALNAAIEAARAGEQGRGFAVVAEEVRKLAEQSQEAAKKIAGLIGAIQEDTEQAVVAMAEGTQEVKTGAAVVDAAGDTFRDIAELVLQVSGQVRDISAAIQQTASGSQHIVGSVKRIDELSKQSAEEAQSVSAATEEQLASMEEIASSSEALAKLAQDLKTAVASFRI
ncbi:methyl-accepting chemotaxis protein [Propionispora vibrioides]|uniref:Methyl-accepting chemotaxis protein n=1 Tax=Propionispora vibrioides TaxID=112903 RepID=A0A1H8W0K5_9FIRM|nr:methyl-accepting chemotaxis protein [Propionispora vibrioides]SEP21192.1 methyl-accepting chemotaxis protein [Propionispora vibrioides]